MSRGRFFQGFIVGYLAGTAGGVLLYKKQRWLRVKLWKFKVQAELDQRVRAMKNLTRDAYEELVEEVLEECGETGAIARTTLNEFEMALKSRWRIIKKHLREAAEEMEDEKE